jgi:hypothetical protein
VEPVKPATAARAEPKEPRPAAPPRAPVVNRTLKEAPLPCVYKPVMTNEDLARCR